MKQLIVAQNIGFCEGVKRSLEMIHTALNRGSGRIFSDGPIVHNALVLDELTKLGVSQFTENIKPAQNDSVVIRAHGVTKERKIFLNNLGSNLIDATCPKILRIIGLVKKYSAQGYFIILFGKHGHPEVSGVCSYSNNKKILVISDENELSNWHGTNDPILVLAQTTFNLELFEKLSRIVSSRFPNVSIVNTICMATRNRQKEVRELVRLGCDSVVVLGSKFSKNTNELAQVAIQNGCFTEIIDSIDDLDPRFVQNSEVLGLISGASTDIREVLKAKKYLLSLVAE